MQQRGLVKVFWKGMTLCALLYILQTKKCYLALISSAQNGMFSLFNLKILLSVTF